MVHSSKVTQVIHLIKDKTIGHYLRLRILFAYYRRDFQSFQRYVDQIRPLDPSFASFGELFLRQFLKSDVSVQEWKDWIAKAESVHPYILGRGYTELVTKLLHEEDVTQALEWFKVKCEKFGFSASDANACMGILKLLIKQNNQSSAQQFRLYIQNGIVGKKFEESIRLKLAEVFYEMDQIPEPRWKKGFEDFEKTKFYRKDRSYFDELKDTYQRIEQKYPSLMDIRTSEQQQNKLRELIHEKIASKKPFQTLRLGDGESYGMHSGRVSPKIFEYDRQAREMKWWGKHLSQQQRENMVQMFQASLLQSDVIGIPGIFRFFRDFFKQTPTARFGLSLVSQTTQRGLIVVMDELRQHLLEQKYPSNCWFVEHRFHQVIFQREDVVSFSKASKQTLFVSKYSPDSIRKFFPELNVDAIQIPDERTPEGSLPDQLDEISEQIRSKCEPGTLVWVAGGFAGKHFLKVAKDAGGVGLDAGAMADYWMGRKTRQVSDIV